MPGMEGLDAEGGEGDSVSRFSPVTQNNRNLTFLNLDEDDDMPELEEEGDEPSSSKGKEAPKIQEVS